MLGRRILISRLRKKIKFCFLLFKILAFNSLLGDNEKDWVCDCKPIYVYYPQTMKCYPVYEQGIVLMQFNQF